MLTFHRFGQQLLEWSAENPRDLPWVKSKDPYLIWISEIMLQQTRVDQVIGYYNKFVQRFSNIRELAMANEDEVLLYWEGLGYYSRARNLHSSARYIQNELMGIFPVEYDRIRALKGVGDYTAAAIASFAFGYPQVAIDGNAIRVLSRCFGLNFNYNEVAEKKKFREIAAKCLGRLPSGEFNQALMDLGARVCKFKKPQCELCPFIEHCYAFNNKQIDDFPPKKIKLIKKNRYLNYLVVLDDHGDSIIIQRGKMDIWKGLFEFPLVEKKGRSKLTFRQIQEEIANLMAESKVRNWSIKEYSHVLTHQFLTIRFYIIELQGKLRIKNISEYKVESVKNFLNFAFPRIIRIFINRELIMEKYVK